MVQLDGSNAPTHADIETGYPGNEVSKSKPSVDNLSFCDVC